MGRRSRVGLSRRDWLFLFLLLTLQRNVWAQEMGNTVLFLELVINQWPTGELIHTEWVDGNLVVQASELKTLGFDIPGVERSFPINEVPGLDVVYEPNEQRLYVEAPPSMLRPQRLRQLMMADPAPVESSSGALLNYDVYATSSNKGSSVSMWNELRWFGSLGVVNSTGVYNPYSDTALGEDGGKRNYIRYDTQWVFSEPEKMYSLRAGDVLSGGLSGARALRIGGVQVARNFNLQPDYITYPLPEFIGSSSVPSSVELYINNMRTFQSNVRPGPFSIETAPYISGAASAQIVTTDALGRQTTASLPLYISSDLLRPGLSDYSMTGGVVREDYGLESFSYGGTPVLDASGRYGLKDWLTVGGHVEATSGIQVAGGGGQVLIGTYGVLAATLEGSTGNESDGGSQYSIGYSYFSSGGGINLQHTQRTDGYADIGTLYGSELLRSSDQVVGTLSLGRQGTLSAGYFAVENTTTGREKFASFSFSRALTRGASVIFSYNVDLEARENSSMMLGFTFALGERRSLNTNVVRDSEGNYSAQLAATQSPPLGNGWGGGASVGSGANPYREVDVFWRGDSGSISGGVLDTDETTTYWGGLRGSVGVIEGHYFAANFIPDAFALVDTGDYADVPIRFANQPMGVTNQYGNRIVSWLNSYIPNYLEIDPSNLPVDTNIERTASYIRPAYRSGVLVDFDIQHTAAAIVTLVDEKGEPLPPGVDVFLKGTLIKGLTGWDGQVYFENVPLGDFELESETRTGRICRAQIHYEPQPGTIPAIGPLICN